MITVRTAHEWGGYSKVTVKGVGDGSLFRVAVLSSGRGILNASFSHYEKAPAGVDAVQSYRGVSPLDRAKYILHVRHAL